MATLVEQIQAAYEAEQKNKPEKVYKASELPCSYEQITEAWLTDILQRLHDGVVVESFELDERDDGSSNRRKIYVKYNKAGEEAGLPTAFFCKATHDLANRIVLGVSNGARIEAEIYNNIRPQLDIEAPHCYFARFDDKTFNSLIMLEDLSGSVTEFCSHKTRMTKERAESQMRQLAELHGRCQGESSISKYLERFPTWPQYFESTFEFGMKEGSNQGFLDGEEVIPASVFRRFDEIWPATEASVKLHESLPHTLTHGDVHLKNWYVAGNGEMGLADWQCASRGHWGRDLAYAITTALTVEDRRTWERDLINYYLDRLQAAGGPKVSFDEAWTHYRQQMMTALTWWTITLAPAEGMPDMQPRDITLEFIRRISTAMEDVDTLDSFA